MKRNQQNIQNSVYFWFLLEVDLRKRIENVTKVKVNLKMWKAAFVLTFVGTIAFVESSKIKVGLDLLDDIGKGYCTMQLVVLVLTTIVA